MDTILDSPSSVSSHSGYAGFWVRFVAVIIDGLVIGIPIWIIGFAAMDMTNPLANMGLYVGFQLFSIIGTWLYEALMVSSNNQATLGKMALGIKVTDLNGEKLSFIRATGRHFAKILSYLILMIGFIMAAFTEKKQALHDILAGALVVRK